MVWLMFLLAVANLIYCRFKLVTKLLTFSGLITSVGEMVVIVCNVIEYLYHV